MHEYLQHQQQQSYHQQQQPLQQFPQNLTYSQKQALKDFDAYELKNLELENKKVEFNKVHKPSAVAFKEQQQNNFGSNYVNEPWQIEVSAKFRGSFHNMRRWPKPGPSPCC